jgi:hypothetical protein
VVYLNSVNQVLTFIEKERVSRERPQNGTSKRFSG